jgi:hypothetical protein
MITIPRPLKPFGDSSGISKNTIKDTDKIIDHVRRHRRFAVGQLLLSFALFFCICILTVNQARQENYTEEARKEIQKKKEGSKSTQIVHLHN